MEIDRMTLDAIQLSVLNDVPIELKIVQDNPSVGIENDTLESLNITDDSAIELHETQDAPIALGVGVEFIDKSAPDYEGTYIVIPAANEDKILSTKGYKMNDDVTVTKVPYFETSNTHGITAYIASEV